MSTNDNTPDLGVNTPVVRYETTPVVDAISQIYFPPFIPETWFSAIKYPGGKPYFLAMLILADLISWYKRTEVVNEETGLLTGYKKKFRDDMLQRSYNQIATKFTCSNREAKAAVDTLKALGLLRTEFRHFKSLSNVLYIEPIPQAILDLTHPSQQVSEKLSTPMLHSNVGWSYGRTSDGLTFKRKTYTDLPNTDLPNTATTDLPVPEQASMPAAVVVDINKVNELYESIKFSGITRGTFNVWIKERGYDYVFEQIEIVKSQPRKSFSGSLVSAIRDGWRSSAKAEEVVMKTKSDHPKTFTREENLVWFSGLSSELKAKTLARAQLAMWNIPADVFPGQSNHLVWFGPFMDAIGRSERKA